MFPQKKEKEKMMMKKKKMMMMMKKKKKKKKKKKMDLPAQRAPLESFTPQVKHALEAPSMRLREGVLPRLERGARPMHHMRLCLGAP